MTAGSPAQTRQQLRQVGAETRKRLGLDGQALSPELLPGFGDLADEVVFGRVWARPGLPIEDRALATLSALTSMQYLPQLRTYIGVALHLGHSPQVVQEVMLHCAMYAGMPTALNSLDVVGSVLDERSFARPTIDPAWNELELDQLAARGDAMKETLHRERADAGYASTDSAASEVYATVATDYLYGEVWERPGPTVRQRMICSVAAFTSLRMESQQRKFFRSARNVGLSRNEIIEVIAQTGPYSGFPSALNAITVAEEVLDD